MGYYDFKTNASNAQPALYLGTFNSGSQIDVKDKYSRYASLTASNFVVEPVNGSTSGSYSATQYIAPSGGYNINLTGTYSASCTFSKSYNPSTGVLSITNKENGSSSGYLFDYSGGAIYVPFSSSSSAGLRAKVYLLPQVEDAN